MNRSLADIAWRGLLPALIVLGFGTAGTVRAATFTVDGTIYHIQEGNDTAMVDGSTVDHWAFTVHSPGVVTFDLLSWERVGFDGPAVDNNGDGEIAFFDTTVYLFDANNLNEGAELATNDDSIFLGTDGSTHESDSYLTYNFLTPGNYILAVGAAGLNASNAIDRANVPNDYPATVGPDGTLVRNHDHGDYRITWTGELTITSAPPSAVPEPASLTLLGLGAVGLVGVRLRRRAAA